MQLQKSEIFTAPVTRLLAVIVLYKMRPKDSPSLRTLLEAGAGLTSLGLDLGVLLFDNTPGGQDPEHIPAGVCYEAAPHNPGLARAYNRALEVALAEGYDWLLTLDQDTALPREYLTRVGKLVAGLPLSSPVGAIVPRVVADRRTISPFRFAPWGVPRWFPPDFIGASQQATYAVNSAAVLRVDVLTQLGGYDPIFPLDISDINLFHRLHRLGKTVFVAGDLLVKHDFSILKKDQRMSIERYRAMLLDECAFWDMNMGPLARLERLVRLAGRACRDSLKADQLNFRRATLSELKRRLITPRAERIANWRKWAQARLELTAGPGRRP